MQPVNYLAAAPQTDFLRNIQGGLQIGQAFQQGQREALLFEQQQQQLQAAQAAQQQYQADVAAAMANPTPAGIRALALKYPQHGKVYTELLSGLSGEQRTAALGDTASLAAALSGGRTDVASRLVDQRIEAMRTRGEQTADVEALRDAIKTDPKKAYGHALELLARFGEDGSKVLETLSKARTQPLTERKTAADASQAESRAAMDAAKVPYAAGVAASEATKASADATTAAAQAQYAEQRAKADLANVIGQNGERWARLGLDRDRLTSEMQLRMTELQQKAGELPDDARKVINDSTTAAVTSQQTTAQMNRLAGELGKLGAGYGAASSFGEWMAAQTGRQDAVTGMRQEYTRLMSQGVMKMLPPGPASDKDVALAREGFPKANADSAYLASFLRGMAKLSAYDAALNNAKAEWVAANKSMRPAAADQEIYGVKVPRGTTFSDFSARFLKEKADEINTATIVSGREYMKYATPQTGGASGGY